MSETNGTNILLNGDFEATTAAQADGVTDKGKWFTADSIEGWVAEEGLIEIQLEQRKGVPDDATEPLDLGQVLELDSARHGDVDGDGTGASNGREADSTVVQDITLTEDGTFDLSFHYAARKKAKTSEFVVFLRDTDGNIVFSQTFSPENGNLEVAWQKFEQSLTLAAGDYTLGFTSADHADADTVGALIDNVSFTNQDDDELLINGSFEDTSAGEADGATDKGKSYTADSIQGWRAESGLIEILVKPEKLKGVPTELKLNLTSGAYLELDSHNHGDVDGDGTGASTKKEADSTVVQHFTLTRDSTYELAFSYAARSRVATSDFDVSIRTADDTVVFSQAFTADDGNLEVAWQRFVRDIDLEAGTYALSFSSRIYADHDTIGALIDNVSLVDVIPNVPPVAVDDTATTAEDTPIIVDILGNDTDPDGDSLSVVTILGGSSTSGPGGGSNSSLVENDDGTFTYTPAKNLNGTDIFFYTVSDGNGGTAQATVSIEVTPVNDAPVFYPGAIGVVTEDTPTPITLFAVDPDGDPLIYGIVDQPQNGTLIVDDETSGRYIYTPDLDFNGQETIRLNASDGKGGVTETSLTFAVTPVNDDPVAADDAATTTEGSAVIIDVLANDTDVDGDGLTVSQVGSPGHGGAVALSDNTIRYTPDANFSGTDSFQYIVEDGNGGSAIGTVTVNVLDVVDSDPEDVVVVGGVAAEAVFGNDLGNIISSGLGADVVDGGGGIDTYQGTLEELDGDVITNFEAGEALVVLGANFTLDDLTFTAGSLIIDFPDGQQTTLQGVEGSAAENNLVIVLPIVGAPGGGTIIGIEPVPGTPIDTPYSNNDAIIVAEDGSRTFDPTANDAIPVGSTITGLTVDPAQNGSVSVNPDGTITYAPDADFNGMDYFTYHVVTTGDGLDQSYSSTVSVTVTAVNDDPTAADGAATTLEDNQLAGTLPAATDADGDTVSYALASPASNGTAIVNGNGAYTYTPNQDFNGADSFTYTVSDGKGGSNTYNFDITVTPDNDPPVANDDTVTVDEDNIVFIRILDNDTDVDGGTLSLVSFSDPANGQAFDSGTDILYQPDADFSGTDSFTYTMRDSAGLTSTATVTITVTPVNDDPVAGGDARTIQEDTDLTLTFAELLANDTDVENDPLTITAVSGATGGAVSIDAIAQTITFDTGLNFNGAAGFDYTVSDGNGGTGSGQVTITVTPVNDPPFAISDSATTGQGEAVVINLLGNDLDFDGDTLQFLGFSGVDNGSAVYNGDGSMTFTPDATFSGVETFNYSITDGAAAAQGTVIVTVEPNAAPVARDDVFDNVAGSGIVGNVLDDNGSGADSDPEGDAFGVVPAIIVTANGGTVELLADGSFTYEPFTGFTGTDVFTYSIEDDLGRSDSADVLLNVVDPGAASASIETVTGQTEDEFTLF